MRDYSLKNKAELLEAETCSSMPTLRSPVFSGPTPTERFVPVEVVDLRAAELAALPVFLTVSELAALLRVGRSAVYKLIARDEIPGSRRIGRSIRISRDAVRRWFSSNESAQRPRCD